MDRILLLLTTTTYKARAFLEAAERLGVPVVAGSDRRQALAAANPGGHLALDFQDPESAEGEIAAFAATWPITAVVAADDEGVALGAWAARVLGTAGNSVDAVLAARNKLRTRQILAEAGLRAPRFVSCSLDDDPLRVVASGVRFPCVLKPLTLSASRGVIRANDHREFVAAFERIAGILEDLPGDPAAPRRDLLVEDFIPGVEVALEGILDHGRLRVLALFDKPDPLDGPFFDETIYVTPSRHAARVQAEIEATTARAVAALGLRHGPVHAELRCNERGAWVLEIAPRSIGGLCSRALRFWRAAERTATGRDPAASGGPPADGISLEELILRQALGRQSDEFEREICASGVMMIPIPRAGILRRIGGLEEATHVEGVEEIRITIPPGHEVLPAPEGSRYLGFIFARGETPQAVEAALRASHARLDIEIQTATATVHRTPRARRAPKAG